jgi:gliding motility associated protien GldN
LYDKTTIAEKQILPYEHLREADVFWQKRVWRVIDTRQKMNQNFGFAKEPFIKVLLDVVKNNPNVRVYLDDEFTTPTTFTEVNSQLGGSDSTFVVDPDTGEGVWRVVSNDFDWATVTRFRVKEDWIFDQEAGRMVVRVLGVSPIRDVLDKNTGDLRGTQAMFWAYYPDLREHLIHKEVFNQQNDSNRLTWDDLFEMRLFSSYIMKESNLQDRRIQDYKNGRDALMESEKIKKEIFEKEHGLWQY